MYAHFKKAPANKKLGVLYVVDSVTRQWLEQARKAGQTLGPDASGATFAAGVNHVTELLPALMQDIIAVAPEDQKVRSLEMLLRSYSPTPRIHNECGREEDSDNIMICSCVDSSSEKLRNIFPYLAMLYFETHVFLAS